AAGETPTTPRARLRRFARRWRRPHAGPDTVWAERWAWADDPRAMSEQALFEEIWTDGQGVGADGAGLPQSSDRPLVSESA
ncbi:MAG TPA: hypothetical protein VGE10_12165, partial [Zeimonas sp.]